MSVNVILFAKAVLLWMRGLYQQLLSGMLSLYLHVCLCVYDDADTPIFSYGMTLLSSVCFKQLHAQSLIEDSTAK